MRGRAARCTGTFVSRTCRTAVFPTAQDAPGASQEVKTMPRIALAASILACTLAYAAPPAQARAMPPMIVDEHGAMYHRNSYRGAPNLNLTLAVVIAGGGPQKFSSAKLISVLAGPLMGPEVAK